PPPCSTLFPYTTLFRSDLREELVEETDRANHDRLAADRREGLVASPHAGSTATRDDDARHGGRRRRRARASHRHGVLIHRRHRRSEEHTSELQSRFDLV